MDKRFLILQRNEVILSSADTEGEVKAKAQMFLNSGYTQLRIYQHLGHFEPLTAVVKPKWVKRKK